MIRWYFRPLGQGECDSATRFSLYPLNECTSTLRSFQISSCMCVGAVVCVWACDWQATAFKMYYCFSCVRIKDIFLEHSVYRNAGKHNIHCLVKYMYPLGIIFYMIFVRFALCFWVAIYTLITVYCLSIFCFSVMFCVLSFSVSKQQQWNIVCCHCTHLLS